MGRIGGMVECSEKEYYDALETMKERVMPDPTVCKGVRGRGLSKQFAKTKSLHIKGLNRLTNKYLQDT